ncbi:protein Shroom4-like isoform X2 [Scleropages formosus]|nr:protein Shroom4 isoform X2 [Scleropages formosus]
MMEAAEQMLVSFHQVQVQVQLQGGAPWGFTLKGGLEHGEPLIITRIEEDGKAAQSKKLRVGDELISINGSALYGSRQEALILIKSSYRILKMVVRRRSVPAVRPHSWHLAKLSEPPGVTAPDAPPAMQIHPGPFGVPWHSGGDSSDLSLHWSQLSRHCSTDRSSSLGSMESLDPPGQSYYESQLSPVDSAMFTNKRDSAYSSFSASSNTSDCAASLRPDEASSIDSLLRGLGSYRLVDGRYQDSETEPAHFHVQPIRKAQSFYRHPEAKARPFSYGCEEERVTVGSTRSPPQPPVRRDSFRATRGRPRAEDKRCMSAPVDMLNVPGLWLEDSPKILAQDSVSHPCILVEDKTCCGHCTLEQHCTFGSKMEPCCQCSQDNCSRESYGTTCLVVQQGSRDHQHSSHVEMPHQSVLSRVEPPCRTFEASGSIRVVRGHGHSAPEKLLLAQMGMLDLPCDPSKEINSYPPLQWSRCPFALAEELDAVSGDGVGSREKWGGSRCSTPGSVGGSEPEEPPVETATSGCQQFEAVCADLKGAASVEALLCGEQDGSRVMSEVLKPTSKSGSSRQYRSSQSRRRSERFATNLRNEIQRKKAQLLKSTDSVNMLYSEETLEEEECVEQQNLTCPELCLQRNSTLSKMHAPQLDRAEPPASRIKDSENLRGSQWGSESTACDTAVCGLVVEEPAPVGKVRRWRWTPGCPVPPEPEATGVTDAVVQSSRNAEMSPHSETSENSDIPPFADRRRFFEESSRSALGSKLPVLSTHRQRPETRRSRRRLERAENDAPGRETESDQRHYSYQGHRCDRPQESGGQMWYGSYSREKDRECTCTNLGDNCGSNRVQDPEGLGMEPFAPVDEDGTYAPPPSHISALGSQETSLLSQRQRTPIEVCPAKVPEPANLNRNVTLTERDLNRCTCGLPPPGGAIPHVHENQQNDFCAPEKAAPEQVPQRGRTLSEGNILLDKQQLEAQVTAGEKLGPGKRGRAPPRPPPPKWEKLYRRRVSHHNLFSRPLSPPKEPPRSSETPSRHDVTRRRSHSLPLRNESESGQDPPSAPCNPVLPQGTFRPVSPTTDVAMGPRSWLSGSQRALDSEQDRAEVLKPVPRSPQSPSGWRGAPLSTDAHSGGLHVLERSSDMVSCCRGFCYPTVSTWKGREHMYGKMSNRGQELPSSPVHPQVGRGEKKSFETDIDKFDESPGGGVATDESQSSAGPGAALETNIDTTPALKPPPQSVLKPYLSSVADVVPGEDTWRGGSGALERSVDTLERRARRGSFSCESSGSRSSYYNTSAAKAQLLHKIKGHRDSNEEEGVYELSYKKQLMESLQKKLGVLREAQQDLLEDMQANTQLGEDVEALVLAVCKPSEVDKFRMFIGDLDKVVSLLLSLSGRLLRVESALDSLSPACCSQERQGLLQKKQQLLAQLREAQELKEHVDRREQAVCQALGRSLAPEQLRDYGHFVKMKAALLVEQRQLEDKIRLGEEQLRGLKESLEPGLSVAARHALGLC